MPSLPALSAGQRPTLIIYPTGGGTGLIGMWKAFDEMEKLGWIAYCLTWAGGIWSANRAGGPG